MVGTGSCGAVAAMWASKRCGYTSRAVVSSGTCGALDGALLGGRGAVRARNRCGSAVGAVVACWAIAARAAGANARVAATIFTTTGAEVASEARARWLCQPGAFAVLAGIALTAGNGAVLATRVWVVGSVRALGRIRRSFWAIVTDRADLAALGVSREDNIGSTEDADNTERILGTHGAVVASGAQTSWAGESFRWAVAASGAQVALGRSI